MQLSHQGVTVHVSEPKISRMGLVVRYAGVRKDKWNRAKAECWHFATAIGYVAGSTTNMHYTNISGPRKKTSSVQTQLLGALEQQLVNNSDCVKAIMSDIGVLIAADMQPFSVVENTGFKHTVKVIEPRYEVPSPPYFSQRVKPALYKQLSLE